LDIRIRLQTHYPGGYPTSKPDSDYLCCPLPCRRNEQCFQRVHQGWQIFFVAFGQNPDQKWPKWLFLENVMAKITNVLTIAISIFIGVSNCLEGSIFFAKKMWFCQSNFLTLKQQFLLYT